MKIHNKSRLKNKICKNTYFDSDTTVMYKKSNFGTKHSLLFLLFDFPSGKP